jgi:aspartate kinase
LRKNKILAARQISSMQVFKFGGGVIRNAEAIRLLADIISQQQERCWIVLSAMNKTTNKLELLISEYLHDKQKFYQLFEEIKAFHLQIADDLGLDENEQATQGIHDLFDELKTVFSTYQHADFAMFYDQVVCYGELLSSFLIHQYLLSRKIQNNFVDIRQLLKTDSSFRKARVNYDLSRQLVTNYVNQQYETLFITQGFIASDENNLSTTLGREGSDYTAALLASMTDSEKVVLWKDVDGIYNADPKFYHSAIRIPELNYTDAIELTELGAKVLHYKSIGPVQERNIPLEVRAFCSDFETGSCIHAKAKSIGHIPIIIHRFNKYMLRFLPKEHVMLDKKQLAEIKEGVIELNMELNFSCLDSNAFYVCLNNLPELILQLVVKLSKIYHVEVTDQVCMLKIRNGNDAILNELTRDKDLLISTKVDDINYIFYHS